LTKVLYSNKALARQAWRLRLDETANLRHILATSADYKKDTLEILLATTLEAVVGAVFIDKKHSLHDTIPFLTALGLNISEKNTPKLYVLPFCTCPLPPHP
jgi:dsRNA-specific ribonuclease